MQKTANSHRLIWVELDKKALLKNLKTFRSLLGQGTKLCPVVKSNAYGHGTLEAARIIQCSGLADWLAVNSADEGLKLRRQGIKLPVLVLGYVPLARLSDAVLHDLRLTVYNREILAKLRSLKTKKKIFLHIKLETGTHRQGVDLKGALHLAKMIKGSKNLALEGYSTHFANIEDTTDRSFAGKQLQRYQKMLNELEKKGFKANVNHIACTAASLVFPQTRLQLARIGIGLYGLWPSRETMVSLKEQGSEFRLEPVMSWKTRVAQVKMVPAGSYIGYGCTFRVSRRTKIAVLPVGYYDGYDRKLSNTAYVLIKGKRAPIRGRVCMNLCMADITDIPGVRPEDEVVLLGKQKNEKISAEQMAQWIGTINYEVVTRINPLLPRVVV
ncbi:alanine racemase [candidate division TA06 bacterium]|uniref:Alanine racemase n=1 Tax=candidate division TA06 bacterium TaxID=2250710 RepID=A0A933MJT5_UNCT6|nr:alanine racemase [candidate division TA06 bacterium]